MSNKIIPLGPEIPTIASSWEEYAERCYSDGMSAEQEQQLKYAFYGASINMLHIQMQIAEQFDEARGMIELTKLAEEINNFYETTKKK